MKNVPIQNLIFDVDGTLLDPWLGVTRCVAFALEELGREYPKDDDMRWFVGPPLIENFAKLLGSSDEVLIAEVMRLYRKRFEETGINECMLYEGIPELLRDLAEHYTLFVATARLQRFTDMLLGRFQIQGFFTMAYGTHLDGKFNDKAELVQHICTEHLLVKSASIMIGDRKHDILAARTAGVHSIGVSYGYGGDEELRSAGAERIVANVNELRDFLLRK